MGLVDHGRLRALMQACGFDGLLVVAPENFAYLVGTPGIPVTIWRRAGPASVVVTAHGAMTVIAPDSRAEDIHRLHPAARVLSHPLWMERVEIDPASAGTPAQIITRATAGRDARRAETYDEAMVLDLMRTAVADAGLLGKRLGIELEFAPALDIKRIRAALGDTHLVDSSHLIREVRAIKTPAEIELHRRATRLTEIGIIESLRGLDDSTTAIDVQARFREAISRTVRNERIPDFESAGSTVNLGPYLWGPEVNPLRRVQSGDLIQFDSGVVLSRSMSDIGRTFSYGRAGDVARHIQAALLAGFAAGKAELRPGRRFRDVFHAAQNAVRANGLPSYARGHLGHSIGSLFIEEWPFISATEQRELEPGMVIAFEVPYYANGVGGFQNEDDVLITANGHESFNALPMELVQI
ncbi:MAG: M24 family metallopeptidase [Thermomicrobiales bacterium]